VGTQRLGAIGLLVLLVSAVACGKGALSKEEQQKELPSIGPSMSGRVTATTRSGERLGTIRVEQNPADSSGSPKAAVRITQTTTVLRADRKGDFNDLRVGDWVRVWFVGPVLESYPVQVQGGVVVVDSLAH
jgi:hypothetical protein